VSKITAPFGSWPSPVTAELLTERARGLSQLQLVAGRLTWNEARPDERGRQVIVGATKDGSVEELLPASFSARTLVHEYGGRCFTGVGEDVVASNWDDQRLWRFSSGLEPVALTAPPPAPRSVRYADPVASPDGRVLVAVRERHEGGAVLNDLVAVPLGTRHDERPAHSDGAETEPVVLASGRDFYAAPAISPDGRRIAWMCWDQPSMPWDDSEIWVAELEGSTVHDARRIAGGTGESVQQPRFSPSGELHYVSDRSGWWNLYSSAGALCELEAEFGQPLWTFGVATYAFTDTGDLIATWSGPGGSGIGLVRDGTVHPLELPYDSYDSLVGTGDGIACIAASAAEAPAVIRLGLDGSLDVVRRSRDVELDSGFVSRPERLAYPTAGGERAWALVYPPTSATHEGPAGEAPPLVVMSHGGPTGQASSALNLVVQFFTSRGVCVADVDYRGSVGYGRAYRDRLRGSWGVCDVEDVAAIARHLAADGRADPLRCAIRGRSAGGFTTLAALAGTDVFAAGADYYGVADLLALAHDTHKFEARYLDQLVGPLPETEQRYRERSPIEHLDGFTAPLVVLQGLEDAVVPPAQSEMIVDALRRRGIPVAYLPFEGEQHGFRKAETIRTATLAELTFYGRILGFRPDEEIPLEIDNLEPA
jgi:dipeptidyl aminopeptidase/acylaminoacyl peptidase